jgi:hypothetical protein
LIFCTFGAYFVLHSRTVITLDAFFAESTFLRKLVIKTYDGLYRARKGGCCRWIEVAHSPPGLSPK